MDAQQIIEYIRTSEKKTPVKVYVWESAPVDFPGCHVFPAAPGHKVVFGDWKDISPVLAANATHITHVQIENNCRNSAIPMLDMKDVPAKRFRSSAVWTKQAAVLWRDRSVPPP